MSPESRFALSRHAGRMVLRRAAASGLSAFSTVAYPAAAVTAAACAAAAVFKPNLPVPAFALAAAAGLAAACAASASASVLGWIDPRARLLCMMKADAVLSADDRLSTAIDSVRTGVDSAMAEALAREALGMLESRRAAESAYPLRAKSLSAALSLALLAACAFLQVAWQEESGNPAGSASPSAIAPGRPDPAPGGGGQERTDAQRPGAGDGAEPGRGDSPPIRSGPVPESSKPSWGSPLESAAMERKGTFEKVFVEPVFSGEPSGKSSAAEPEKKLGPGEAPVPAPLPGRSISWFRKTAEESLKRSSFGRRDQMSVARYFDLLEKRLGN